MGSVFIFLIALSSIFFTALIFNKFKGIKAHYIDFLLFAAGEEESIRDTTADFYIVTKFGQAMIMSFARMKRTYAIVTNQRIVIGQRVLFGKRYMITHMIYFNTKTAPEEELAMMAGGLYSKGYQIFVTDRRSIITAMDGKKTFVKIIPLPTKSATNIEHCRLYSDLASEICKALQ